MTKRIILTAVAIFLSLIFFTACSERESKSIDFKWVWQNKVCFLVPENDFFEYEYTDSMTSYKSDTQSVEIYVVKKEYFDSVLSAEVPEKLNFEYSAEDTQKISDDEENDIYLFKENDRGVYIVDCGYYAVYVVYYGDMACAQKTAESATRNESLDFDAIVIIKEKLESIYPEKNIEVEINRNKYGEAELLLEYESDEHFIKDRISEFCNMVSELSQNSGLYASDIPTKFMLYSSQEIKMQLAGAYSFENSKYKFECIVNDEKWEKYYEELRIKNEWQW